MKIGVQQFQLRYGFKNDRAARKTLAQVKALGLDGIELDDYLLTSLPFAIRLMAKGFGMAIPPTHGVHWREDIEGSGLEVLALHEDLGSLENPKRFAAIVEKAHAFKTPYIVITGMFRYDYSSYDAVLDLVRRLNAVGERLKQEKLALLYHNHNCEFRPCGGEKAFDVILRKSQSEFVNFEFDSYWCAECGASPLEWMAKLGSRLKLYHINDRGCKTLGALPSIVKSDSAELGLGNLPLEDYIKEAETLGVEAIIIESHQNWLENSALASLRCSMGYLRKHL